MVSCLAAISLEKGLGEDHVLFSLFSVATNTAVHVEYIQWFHVYWFFNSVLNSGLWLGSSLSGVSDGKCDCFVWFFHVFVVTNVDVKMSLHLMKNLQWFHAYKCWHRSVVSCLAAILLKRFKRRSCFCYHKHGCASWIYSVVSCLLMLQQCLEQRSLAWQKSN